jgi:hypothetical protein
MRTLGPLALAALSACQAGAVGGGRAVPRFPGFPAEAVVGEAVFEARLYRDHEAIFGADLPDESDVLPIALRMGLSAGSPSKVRFAPDAADLRLVLPDGTVLRTVPAASISTWSPKGARRASRSAAEPSWLPEWAGARDQFVYFALHDGLYLHGGEVLHHRGEVVRRLDLERALVAFEVEVDGERTPVHVGLKLDHGARR